MTAAVRSSSASARVPAAAFAVVLGGVSAALHLGKLPPAVPALQASLGIDLVEAGFLLSLVQVASMTLGLLAGLAADSIGLRRSMLVGLAVLTTASLLGAPSVPVCWAGLTRCCGCSCCVRPKASAS